MKNLFIIVVALLISGSAFSQAAAATKSTPALDSSDILTLFIGGSVHVDNGTGAGSYDITASGNECNAGVYVAAAVALGGTNALNNADIYSKFVNSIGGGNNKF